MESSRSGKHFKFLVRCQIYQAAGCVSDECREVGIDQEVSFHAPDFLAKITIRNVVGETIGFTADLESGYRYVTPDLETENGKMSTLEFYGTTAGITVTSKDAGNGA
jgi:hypothetical protein